VAFHPPVVHDPIPFSSRSSRTHRRRGFKGVLEQAFSLGLEGATFITAYPQREALRSAAAIKAGSRLTNRPRGSSPCGTA
jgi:hypothetical protein